MAKRKARTGSRRASPAKASVRRRAIKKTTKPSTVKLVVEGVGASPVARPDGIAGAFQVADRNAGRARF